MTSITRRDALRGATAAAVVTGAATAPLAIKAALGGEVVAQAVVQDPVIATIDRYIALFLDAYPSFDQFPEDTWGKIEEELEPVKDRCDNLLCDVFRVPARSLDGALLKARLAYRIELEQATGSREPVEDMAPPSDGDHNIRELDSQQLVWSLLRDLERLAGEARP